MLHRFRILVAEDDASVRELICMRLEVAGYEVSTARNGVETISRARAWQPHAMILDINMPEMTGFDVLETLEFGRIPTLVLTARHAAEDVKRAVSLGAKDYLTKPFDDAKLLARVARLLRQPFVVPKNNAKVVSL